jgi:hypothetical protein
MHQTSFIYLFLFLIPDYARNPLLERRRLGLEETVGLQGVVERLYSEVWEDD